MRTCGPLARLVPFVALLVVACGDDGGASGTLQQGDASVGPDGLTGDAVGDSSPTSDTSDTIATSDPGTVAETASDAVAPNDTDAATADATAADTLSPPDTALDGPTLTVRVVGDRDDRAPDDGLAGQTPSVWSYGLQRLELLRTRDDPNPEVVFDHAPGFVLVDLLGDNVIAEVPIAQLPSGTFPYFRIVLTHAHVVVAAALHQVPVLNDYASELDITYALSDVRSGDLDMRQGDAIVSANIFGQLYRSPTHWTIPAPSPAPNAWASAVDGEWRVTFGVNPALTVSPQANLDVTYAIRFYVTNAFRWRDAPAAGHANGVWDIDLGPPAAFEPIERFGANAYEVYYQGP